MTTKADLLAKIKELQAQVDVMPDDMVNPVFIPDMTPYHVVKIGSWNGPQIGVEGVNIGSKIASFRTLEAAKAYGEAFQTILELHALSEAVSGEGVWGIIGINGEVKAGWWRSLSPEHFFGRFASEQLTQAAIDKIGKDRIQRAFNVLAKGEV